MSVSYLLLHNKLPQNLVFKKAMKIYFVHKFAIWLGLSENGPSAPCGISGIAQRGLKNLLLRWVSHVSVKLALAVTLKVSKGWGRELFFFFFFFFQFHKSNEAQVGYTLGKMPQLGSGGSSQGETSSQLPAPSGSPGQGGAGTHTLGHRVVT